MYRLLFALILALSFSQMQAQTPSSNDQVKELTQRVDSLEHELSYMKLLYELYTLNTDITIFANEVGTQSATIQLNIYNRNFNSRLGEAYKQYFDSCISKKESLSKLIEAKKTFFAVKVFTYPFSEGELNTLFASYNVINNAFETLEKSMEMLKITIDAYRKLM